MATTIKLKNGSGAPLAGDLVQGEPALDLTNKRLYTEDSGGSVIEVGTNPTSLTTGTFTSVGIDDNATSTAITIDASENVGIGTGISPDSKLQVVKDHTTAYSTTIPFNTFTNDALLLSNEATGTSTPYSSLAFEAVGSSGAYTARMIAGNTTGGSGYLAFQSRSSADTANTTEVMRIVSSGNVGIGTDSPLSPLVVSQTDDYNLEVQLNNATYGDVGLLAFSRNGAGYRDLFTRAENIIFYGGGTSESMRIDSSGNVGIGETNPYTSLHATNAAPPNDCVGVFESGTGATYLNFRGPSSASTQVRMGMRGNGVSLLTNSIERMFIDSSGNVGIGTGSPTSKLSVVSGTNAGITVNDGTVNTILFNTSSANGSVGTTTNHPLAFYSNNTERMRIDASGNVGIGTDSSTDLLTISSTVAASSDNQLSSTGTGGIKLLNPTSAAWIETYKGGAEAFAGGLQFSVQSFTGGNYTRKHAMRIDSSGNVGIGTDSPLGTLSVQYGGAASGTGTASTSASGVVIDGSNQSQGISILGPKAASDTAWNSIFFGNPTDGTSAGRIRYSNFSNYMSLFTDSTERMRIDSSGSLLVGTTSNDPNSRGFTVRTSISTAVGVAGIGVNAHQTATTNCASFSNANGQVGSITTSGSATTYNTSSDVRLKENITDADSSGSIIDALQVRQYDWKADGSHDAYGFVAQELEQVYPKAVSKGETEDDTWGVDYSKLVPMLVKEIQDLRERVSQLEGA